jgi:hypothetical protein
LELAGLQLEKKLTPNAIAQKTQKLQARIKEIQHSLQSPCPSKYSSKQFRRDRDTLGELTDKLAAGEVLTATQSAAFTRVTAIYDSFAYGPENAAHVRLKALRLKKRIADQGGPKLTPVEQTNFRFLSLIYPPEPTSIQDMDEEFREAILRDHPFVDPPYIVGNPNYPDGFLFFGTPTPRKFT